MKNNINKTKESLAQKLSFNNSFTPSTSEPNSVNTECNNSVNTECNNSANTESQNSRNTDLNNSDKSKKKKSKCTFYILNSILEDFDKFYLTLKMTHPKIDRSDLITQAIKDLMQKKIEEIERF
jgi:hypothetical protein